MKPPRALALALCAAALALPVSIALSNAALGLLTLALLYRLRGADRGRALAACRAEPALAAVVAYIVAGLIASIFGFGLAHSLHDNAKDLHRLWSLSLFVAALALEPEAPLWPAFAAGFALAAAVGVRQSALGWLHTGALERAAAFVHPVTFGEQMGLGTLGGLCWLARPSIPGARARAAAAAATLLYAAAMTLSQTRAAMLAFAAGAVAVALLEPRARRWAAAGLGLGALGAGVSQYIRFSRGQFNLFGPETEHSRLILWRVAWRMFRDHPWTGVGLRHYATLFDRYSPPYEGQAHWGTAHNIYLHQLAERGLIGFAALMCLLAVLLVRGWRAGRANGSAAALWAAAAVPAFMIMNGTETALQTEQFATLFLMIWAWGTISLRPRAEIL